MQRAGDARIRGEASPNYLEDPEAPALIDRTVPDARVIATLRDPVERLFSRYLMMRNNRLMGNFTEEVERCRSVFGPRFSYYRGDVRRLEGLLGQRMPWQNFGDAPALHGAG